MKTPGTRDEEGVIEHAASSILLEHLALVLRIIWSSAILGVKGEQFLLFQAKNLHATRGD